MLALEAVEPTRTNAIMKASMFERLASPTNLSFDISRIDIYLHQIETVLRVLERENPRFILADEVGLGKTIEALMVAKELEARGRTARSIFLVPASLVKQWNQEMTSKFDISPFLLDSSNLISADLSLPGTYLASVDFAKRHPEAFAEQQWDLVVIDEAHHIRRQQDMSGRVRSTLSYDLAESIAGHTHGLLLLTATPMQLDEFEFYSLLKLLDERVFPDYGSFEYYYQTLMPRISSVIRSCERGEVPRPEADMVHARVAELFFQFKVPELPDPLTPERTIELFQSLLVLPSFMIRHRKREEFPDLPPRCVMTIPVKYTDEEMALYREISDVLRRLYVGLGRSNNRSGLIASTYQQMLTSSPRAISRSLEGQLQGIVASGGEDLGPHSLTEDATRDFVQRLSELPIDSKLEALVKIVGGILFESPNEKIIIFVRYLETQRYLAEVLGQHFKVALFSGEMGEEEKDSNIAFFKRQGNILISTEAGGEGRNLQFAHIMVNYDLPWNPIRLEQRIGRIDRIGQKRKVQVYNLVIDGTIEARIFQAIVERVERFSNIIGALDAVLGDVEQDLTKIALGAPEDAEKEFEDYLRLLDTRIRSAREAMEVYDSLTSFQRRVKERAIASRMVVPRFPTEEFEEFVIEQLAKVPGVSIKPRGGSDYDVSIPKGALHNNYDAEVKATFDPSREGRVHLSLDNPIVSNLLGTLLGANTHLVSFERNGRAPPHSFWCFNGGPANGFCVVKVQDGAAQLVDPQDVISLQTFDADRRACIRPGDEQFIGGLELARMVAERALGFPEGGASLVCVRFVNPSQDGGARG